MTSESADAPARATDRRRRLVRTLNAAFVAISAADALVQRARRTNPRAESEEIKRRAARNFRAARQDLEAALNAKGLSPAAVPRATALMRQGTREAMAAKTRPGNMAARRYAKATDLIRQAQRLVEAAEPVLRWPPV